MKIAKIALWVFIALVISAVMFGVGLATDVAKMGGWDKVVFGVGTQYNVNDIKELNYTSARRVEITTTSSDTTLFSSDSDKVKAALTGSIRTTEPNAVPTLEVRQSGDVITITERRQTFITFGFYSSNVKLDISIPKRFSGEVVFKGTSGNFTTSNQKLEKLDVSVSSGDTDIENVELSGALNLSANSGNIKVNNVKASDTKIETSSGDKELYNLTLSGNASMNANSGQTKVQGLTCAEGRIESTSGDIEVSGVKAKAFYAKASSGEIIADIVEGKVQLESTAGDIETGIQNPKDEIKLQASSGEVTLSLPEETGFKLDSQASSGNIHCKFDLSSKESERNALSGIAGSGEIPVFITTHSGDININKR
ncbi:MAG: DUF4097 domain-containing protein [Clostridia bacterium]|nr:DUF4097 domain-containing protein [Clostridia bacterium]